MPDLIQQQIAYYRARAAEYNEWWYRQGRYDRGAALNQRWFDEAEKVRAALLAMPHQDHILELACGTGLWTQELLKVGRHVTAVDASPEMIAINQAALQSDRVTYVQSDIFTWQPDQHYDMVFFSFWLSHVPPERLPGFLQQVSAMLKPGGRLFILDSRRTPDSTAIDHVIPEDGTTLERKLNDGQTFQIVKVFYNPADLQASLQNAGIAADAHLTDTYFITVRGTKMQD